ncbi:6722_t:CDS:2, partial [Cetraspora pellucida]
MTKIDEEHDTTSMTTLLHEPTLQLPEIDQRNARHSFSEPGTIAQCYMRKELYEKLDEFVSDEVWKQLLQMHLKAMDQMKLKKNPEILIKLGVFVCQIIKTIIIAQDNNKDLQRAIRKCDEYTVDLEISTKLGI